MKKLNLLILGIGLVHSLGNAQSQLGQQSTMLNPSLMKYGSVIQLQCIARVDSKSSVFEIFSTCKNISSAVKIKPTVNGPVTEPVLVMTTETPAVEANATTTDSTGEPAQIAPAAESAASAASVPAAAMVASGAASGAASESSFIAAAMAASDLAIQVNQILNSSATKTETAGYTLLNRDKKVKVLTKCLLDNGLVSSSLDYQKIFLNCYSRALLTE